MPNREFIKIIFYHEYTINHQRLTLNCGRRFPQIGSLLVAFGVMVTVW